MMHKLSESPDHQLGGDWELSFSYSLVFWVGGGNTIWFHCFGSMPMILVLKMPLNFDGLGRFFSCVAYMQRFFF